MSIGSFHLKGGGWYKDGYGTKQKKEETHTPPKSTGEVTKGRSLTDD